MMILVTGGSGSGKSAFAEDCIVAFGNARRIYIATMYPFDEESRKRVKRHQAMRQRFVLHRAASTMYVQVNFINTKRGVTVYYASI